MNLGEILNEVCREKNLDKHKYELRHPGKRECTFVPRTFVRLTSINAKNARHVRDDTFHLDRLGFDKTENVRSLSRRERLASEIRAKASISITFLTSPSLCLLKPYHQ